jgi:hypothetical protein
MSTIIIIYIIKGGAMTKTKNLTGKKSASKEVTDREYALLQSMFDQLSKENKKVILDKAETLVAIQNAME